MTNSIDTCSGIAINYFDGVTRCQTCGEALHACTGEKCCGAIAHHRADICQDCGKCLPGSHPA